MVSLTILLVIQTALAAKGQSKRQVSKPNDQNQPGVSDKNCTRVELLDRIL